MVRRKNRNEIIQDQRVPKTKEIVTTFISDYTEFRGPRWDPLSHEYLSNIRVGLYTVGPLLTVAQNIHKFIEKKNKAKFEQMCRPLIEKLVNLEEGESYPILAFQTIASELIKEPLSWSCIMTFFVYFAEIAVGLCEIYPQGTILSLEELDERINVMIDWMVHYIDDGIILDWVLEQDGEWCGIVDDPIYQDARKEEEANSAKLKRSQQPYKFPLSYINGYSLAAVAIFIGLFVCSKLTVQ